MMLSFNRYIIVIAVAASAVPAATALATDPKIDADTCTQLRLEQIKFRQSGILDDMQKGPEWAKANLTPDRLREVEHYMALDEQVKFGCRDAKLSPEAEKASEAASRIEINSDADPTVPEGAGETSSSKASNPAAPKHLAHKRTTHKKAKSAAPEAQSLDKATQPVKSKVTEGAAPPVAAAPAPELGGGPAPVAPDAAQTGPAIGFGETTGQPHISP